MRSILTAINPWIDLTMKKQILFVHSGGLQGPHEGSNDLVKYLVSELGNDYELRYPKMPNPENPSYFEWKEFVTIEMESMEGPIIMIGHSLGGSVLVKCLSEEICTKEIIGLFLVAAPFFGTKDWRVQDYALDKNFSRSLPPIPKIFLYHSLNDEVVPFAHLNHYADKLPGAIIRTFGSSLHLFHQGIPILIQDIKKL